MLSSDIASTLPNIKGRFIVKDNSFYEVQCFYFSEISPMPQPSQELEKVNQTKPKDVDEEQEHIRPGKTTFSFDFSDFTK